ncbi:hypothetical protein Bca101_088514 [Brassica carinata]
MIFRERRFSFKKKTFEAGLMKKEKSTFTPMFEQAKLMFVDDPKYNGGWKFDYVWNNIKNLEKFNDTYAKKVSNSCGFGDTNSASDSATQESPGLSSFSLNLDDEEDIIGGSSSKRPIEVKKSKLKRKKR